MPRINRVYTKNYTVVGNEFLDDADLTASAKGVLAYLLKQPDDWTFYIKELVNHFKDGRDAIRHALDELEESGYLLRERLRNKAGQFTSNNNWLLADEPQQSWIAKAHKAQKTSESAKPKSENPTLDNPTLVNPTLQSTNQTNYLLNKVFNLFSHTNIFNKHSIKDSIVTKEQREKAKQVFNLFRMQANYWVLPLDSNIATANPDQIVAANNQYQPSKHEFTKLAKAIGNKEVTDIIGSRVITIAAVNAKNYPIGYLTTLITNLPDKAPEVKQDNDLAFEF